MTGTKKNTRRKYDLTFKEDVIKMLASGRPVAEVSKALGVSGSLIRRWYKSTYAVSAKSGKNSDVSSISHNGSLEEMERLRAELRRTEQERDIFKKSLGNFQPRNIATVYAFVDTLRYEHPLGQICKVLQISRSCFYEWNRKNTYQPKAHNTIMEQKVIAVFRAHKRRYGSRRIVAELQHQNVSISSYRVRKYLTGNGLKAIQPRSFVPKTTNSRHPYQISPNYLKQKPFLVSINQVWVGDITYIPMGEGRFRYLSVWMDLCSRKIVGWDLQDHMRESLVTASLGKALRARKVTPGLLIHSDRGGQYAGTKFREIIEGRTMVQSMSDRDNPYDNAHMESFFSRFKAELMEESIFQGDEDSHNKIFEYIEMYYNSCRLHSSIGYLSPNNFEKQLSLA